MTITTEAELEALKKIGAIVAACLRHMGEALVPGITTAELDDLGTRFLERYGARSAPRLCYDFPGSTCISVNEEVAHGIPGARRIADGDLVNVDVSAELDGFFADTGGSFVVGRGSDRAQAVCRATRAALEEAIKKATGGAPLNRIGETVERVATRAGFRVVKNLGSHGVGASLHEEPRFVPSYYDRRDKRRLTKGMVMTIEPFLTTGPDRVREGGDGWTLLSVPGAVTAQYEHTIVITEGRPLVLTRA
jgi:methionyl aminopeptidase